MTDADLCGLLQIHVDIWGKCMKESFVNRKYFMEILGVEIDFVAEIGHGHRDIGRVIGRHLGKWREGEDADVLTCGIHCDACGKGRHGAVVF